MGRRRGNEVRIKSGVLLSIASRVMEERKASCFVHRDEWGTVTMREVKERQAERGGRETGSRKRRKKAQMGFGRISFFLLLPCWLDPFC